MTKRNIVAVVIAALLMGAGIVLDIWGYPGNTDSAPSVCNNESLKSMESLESISAYYAITIEQQGGTPAAYATVGPAYCA